MNYYKKRGMQLATIMMMMGADLPKVFDEPQSRNLSEKYVCKNCGKEFKPRSQNKKVFCTTECFLEYKNSH